MKPNYMYLFAAALALGCTTTAAIENQDRGAIIETMEGTVEHVDLEANQLVVADFVYVAPATVRIRRGGAAYVGLDRLQVGDQVVLHMPPGQHWELPMPVAEIEVQE